MIRFRQTGPDGDERWVLISQPEHARLAGQLAAAWAHPGWTAIEPRDEVLDAVTHHDDGWIDWERSPDVDSEGNPRQFTDMPLDVALTIWRSSIAICRDIGPLAGAMVAGHFAGLLRRFPGWRDRCTAEEASQADSFLAEQDQLCRTWREAWLAADRRHRPKVADAALAHLQMFDAISLWLCGHDHPKSFEPEPPAGEESCRFDRVGNRTWTVSPWPFRAGHVRLEAATRIVAAAAYANREALAEAPKKPCAVEWQLRRSE